jgi:hypothetical protein
MTEQQTANEQQWKLLVLLLKELAIQKLGNGWQTQLSEKTNFTQSNISRIFSLQYKVTLKNFLIIAKAIEVNFFFEDKKGKSDLTLAFEKAMEALGRRPDKLPKN